MWVQSYKVELNMPKIQKHQYYSNCTLSKELHERLMEESKRKNFNNRSATIRYIIEKYFQALDSALEKIARENEEETLRNRGQLVLW